MRLICKAIIDGEPYPKARPRCTFTGRVRATDRQVAAERIIAWEMKAQNPGLDPWDGPVRLSVAFYAAKQRGDCSNMVKAVEDALNTIAFCDDRQVVEIDARLVRSSNEPRTEVAVYALDS